MSAESPLTRDDLDELSDGAYDAADPVEVAAQLVAAADAGRVADRADVGYAHRLAAEIYERADELPQAVAAVEQALAVEGGDAGPTRALRAQLLLRLGREQEAMAELTALRPLMSSDALAAAYVPEALAGGGRAELAQQWLREALAAVGQEPDHPVVAQLTAAADRLREATGEPLADPLDGPGEHTEAVLLVWPEAEYEQVDERWPEVLEATGADGWEDYRRRQQRLIAAWDPRRRGSLWLVSGTAEGFAEFLVEEGADPAGDDLVSLAERYGDYLFEQVDARPLPPDPADDCWCASGLTYGKCCLSLTAASAPS